MKGLCILLGGMQLSNLFSFILSTLLVMTTFSFRENACTNRTYKIEENGTSYFSLKGEKGLRRNALGIVFKCIHLKNRIFFFFIIIPWQKKFSKECGK